MCAHLVVRSLEPELAVAMMSMMTIATMVIARVINALDPFARGRVAEDVLLPALTHKHFARRHAVERWREYADVVSWPGRRFLDREVAVGHGLAVVPLGSGERRGNSPECQAGYFVPHQPSSGG